MDRKYARRRIKAEVWRLLPGNWLKVVFLLLVTILFVMLISNLLPIRNPSLEEVVSAEEMINEAVSVIESKPEGEAISEQEMLNVARAVKHSINLYIPKGLSANRMIASLVVTALLFVLVTRPYDIGVCKFFLKVAKGQKAKLGDAFSVFTDLKTVFSSIWLSCLVFFISVFWTVIFVSVPILLILAGSVMTSEILVFIGSSLLPVAFIFAILWNSRYTFAKYIFAEGKKGAFASLRECIELMRGRTSECIALRFSYFIWDILAGWVAPLTFVYFAVYGTGYAKYLYYLRGDAAFSDETPHTAV